jgi:hypothetical protein
MAARTIPVPTPADDDEPMEWTVETQRVNASAFLRNMEKATADAATFSQLVDTIPLNYRAQMGDFLSATYRTASKLVAVQQFLNNCIQHKSDGTFPPVVLHAFKLPKVQFSNDFSGSAHGRPAQDALSTATHKSRVALLDSVIKQKELEKKILTEKSSFKEQAWKQRLLETAEQLGPPLGYQVLGDITSDEIPVWEGLSSNQPVEILGTEIGSLWRNGDIYHYRVIAFARSVSDKQSLAKQRKLSAKTRVETKLQDEGASRPVAEVVAEKLKPLELQLRQLTQSTLPRQRQKRTLLTHIPRQEEEVPKAERQRHTGQGQEHRSRWQQDQGHEEEETIFDRRKTARTKVTVPTFLSACSREFNLRDAGTFPSVYLELSLRCQLKIHVALMRTLDVETIRHSRPGCFQHELVSLPKEIDFALSVNHKFIFQQTPKNHDVARALEGFQRAVRLRWFFRSKTPDSNFLPKFHVKNPDWKPPPASRHIEQGIEDAITVIRAQVHEGLVDLNSQPRRPSLTGWDRVHDYLDQHLLMAKITDKNLGLAVFPVEWYLDTVNGMLSDPASYEAVTDVNPELIFQELMDKLGKWKLPAQMENFIRKTTKQELPRFHAIPKVHKDPWKLRPIVPSHSWVTSTLSTVVDHLIQPLLALFPWVLSSTKELVQATHGFRFSSKTDVWIITGDVTACYTNIPSSDCATVVAKIFARTEGKRVVRTRHLRDAVKFIMDNNFFGFHDKTYKQVNGLAMGTSCAPVLANLYMAYHEESSRLWDLPCIDVYRRYIDDIFILAHGPIEEVTEALNKLTLGPLDVTWSVERNRNHFLDADILTVKGLDGLTVETRLYRKFLNRHLYIPWSSAHPVHTKKGFVKAELTRLVMLCSQYGWFADARKEFHGHLRRRGYPSETLDKWFSLVRYMDRNFLLFGVKPEEGKLPLMLHGHYNPVWEYVKVSEVIAAARKHWSKEELPETLEVPLIRSLARTKNLSDRLSVWNKTLLDETGSAWRAGVLEEDARL